MFQFLEKIDKYFKDRFKLKSEDYDKLKLLFLFSFFLGFFIAFYFVPANSQFLQNFGHKELPFAYIVSGVVGTLAIGIYSRIQRHYKSKILFITAIFLMLILSLISKIALVLIKNSPNYSVYYKYLSFFVFIWAWPFIAFVATVTGGLAVRLLNLLQVKKFYGLINLGGVIAAIIGYFSISLLIKILPHHYDLILIGDLGLIAAIILVFYIYKKFPEQTNSNQQIENEHILLNFNKLLKNKFILFIFLTALLSSITIFLVDYGFLITIKSQSNLFETEQQVATFMSIVFAGLKIGEFLISLVSGRILSRWGLRLGLTFMGISVSLIFLGAFVSAEIFSAASFWFLGFITANKMLERIIRRGIDDPSFNVLYQTLPDNQKLYIQTRVGVVQQFSIAIAGLLLLVLNNLISRTYGFEIKFYPAYVLPILILFIFTAFTLYKHYKNRIHEILEEKKLFQFEYVEKDVFALDILQKNILSSDSAIYKFSVLVLSETNPRSLEDYANFLLKIDDKLIRKIILLNIDSTYSEKLVYTIEKIGDQISFKERELQKLIIKALFNLDFSDITQPKSIEEIEKLAYSDDVRKRINATKYLIKYPLENDEKIILRLLDDPDRSVKLAAIKIASKRKYFPLWEKLIKLLNDPEFNNLIINILVQIGEDILQPLKNYFNQTDDLIVKEKIIQIFAKIGTNKAQRILISFMNFPDRHLQEVIIDSLYYSDFKSKEDTREQIVEKIKEIVENVIWLYAAIKEIVREKNTLKLVQSLDLERIASLNKLFKLLSFIHQPELVDLIETNIIGENTIFALELIDNFIDNEIKRLILPLFEPISLGQKIKRLKPYFSQETMDFERRLIDIVLKDYSKIDTWTQAKAIELIGRKLKGLEIKEPKLVKINYPEIWTEKTARQIYNQLAECKLRDLIVALYNPDTLVFGTAVKILYKHYPKITEKIFETLPKDKQVVLEKLKKGEDLIIDKIKKLKRIYVFYTVPEKSLLRLAKIIEEKKLNKNEKITFYDDENNENIFLVVKGLVKADNKIFDRNHWIIRGLNVSNKTEELIMEKNANLLAVNRFKFFNLLATDREIIKHLFNRMQI